MKLDIAICVHNETSYITDLLQRLLSYINIDKSGVVYQIIIIDDFSDDLATQQILSSYQTQYPHIVVTHAHALNNHYANHKNFMNLKCTGDWILNLDADEWVTDDFLGYIPMIIDANPLIDAYWIPRVNTVDGLTLRHLQLWKWVITKDDDHIKTKLMDVNSEEYKLLKDFDYIITEHNGIVVFYEPIIAWPDFQMRLYKNAPTIHWINSVHERLIGFQKYGMLPTDITLAIRHYKDINRQERQNRFYNDIQLRG